MCVNERERERVIRKRKATRWFTNKKARPRQLALSLHDLMMIDLQQKV